RTPSKPQHSPPLPRTAPTVSTLDGPPEDHSLLRNCFLFQAKILHSSQYKLWFADAFYAVPPKEPPIITCRSNTYPKGFYCSWHLQHPTYIPTDFEVQVRHNQKFLEVQRDATHKNRCHVKFPELFSTFKYRVNVTAINALGQASNVISFDEFVIVKPDPPEKVVATPIPKNARRLEVTWNSPSTWPDVENFPLKYFLRYRPLIREQWQHTLIAFVVKKD
ncbi:ciliary neurotrophic factor receptor alpha precursor (CNTFR alpha)-like, partial [Scleropages formosus]